MRALRQAAPAALAAAVGDAPPAEAAGGEVVMVAYSFQKRFIGQVLAGLEPGPWLPGMKRHTLRQPRLGRAGHARPEQPVHLYTAMRTKHCRQLGLAVCRLQMRVRLLVVDGEFSMERVPGAMPRSKVADLAPIVRTLMDEPASKPLWSWEMDEFARTDGFADRIEMASYFEAPFEKPGFAHLDMVLIAWTPAEAG